MTPVTIEARFVPARQRCLGEAAGSLVFDCPWCGREHFHGAGTDAARPLYGSRSSHCRAPGAPDGYVLVPPKESTP